MSLTHNEAYDEICAMLNVYWLANAGAVVGGAAPAIEWPNIPSTVKLDEGNEPWQRFDLKFMPGKQKTFGEEGNRYFDRWGTFTCQIFVPLNKRGLELSHNLGKVALDAFEGKTSPGGVRFYDVGQKTVGKSGDAWQQLNVTGRFEFEEIK